MVDPEDARIFDGAMASFTAAGNEAILSGYDFSPFSNIVDGGDGSLDLRHPESQPRGGRCRLRSISHDHARTAENLSQTMGNPG